MTRKMLKIIDPILSAILKLFKKILYDESLQAVHHKIIPEQRVLYN